MPKPNRSTNAQPTAAPERVYPVGQVNVGDLAGMMNHEQLCELLTDRSNDAWNAYFSGFIYMTPSLIINGFLHS